MKIIERPGYIGPMRDELTSKWNSQFGESNWALVWDFGNEFIDSQSAHELVAQSYVTHFQKNPQVVDWLSSFLSVYDTATTNIFSGLDYTIQETECSHIHDIAIRNAMHQIDAHFTGNELLQIRGPKSKGWSLDPSQVLFHRPDMIYHGEIKNYQTKHAFWWRKYGIENSIETFYQQNKVLVVKE